MKLEEFAIKLREAQEERAESKVVPVFYYANMENNEG